MRPRPDAAENAAWHVAKWRREGASMRPRPDAAENRSRRSRCPAAPHASMRPRPDAAENPIPPTIARKIFQGFNEAAARCRGKRAPAGSGMARRPRFNEAAARCRGKLRRRRRAGRAAAASMRPRPDAAENTALGLTTGDVVLRFNEAAARCRGKRRACGRAPPSTGCFNEAAARCRGKHSIGRSMPGMKLTASMRPRPDAAENGDNYSGRIPLTPLQ